MGVRGEIYSTTVGLQNRTYFFNVKENRMGDLYLNIVESKNKDSGGFDRQSVILFADDLAEFLKGFDDSLRVLEKAMKEKRRDAPRSSREARVRDDRPRKKAGEAGSGEAPQRGGGKSGPSVRGGPEKKRYTGKPAGGTRGKAKDDNRKPGKVVVRKRDRDE